MIRFSLSYLFVFSLFGCIVIAEPAQSEEIEKLYTAAVEAMQSSHWNEALIKLELLSIKHPSNIHIEEAKLSMPFCYMQRKEFDKALSLIHAFIKEYPQSKYLEDALKLKNEIEASKHSLKPNNPQDPNFKTIWGYVWRGGLILIGVNIAFSALLTR